MTAIKVGDFQPNTERWYELRSRGIGGSEAAAIVGLSPWTSRFTLYHRKRGTIAEQESSRSMDWGKRLEPVILDAFEELHPFPGVVRKPGTWVSDDRPWQISNPDAILDGFPVDAKTASAFDAHEWGPDGSDMIPPYYRTQLIHYGDTFGVRKGYIALLMGGSDFRTYEVTWDESEAAWLRSQCETFWADVVAGNAPDLDGSDSTYQTVRKLHPDINGDEWVIPEDLYERYAKAVAQKALTETALAGIRTKIADGMADAQYAVNSDGARIFRRQAKNGGTPYLAAIPRKDAA